MIFLRPWAFLALLFPIFWLWYRHHQNGESPWKKFMDKDLWRALSVNQASDKTVAKKSRLILLLWLILTLALSGPAWYKLPTPARISQPNTVIVMDLNPEMNNDTLKKMQMRLYDLLDALKGHRVGLVLYGTDEGYTAMPLTPDRTLIQQLIPDLRPNVLPQVSLNPKVGIRQAEQLLNRTQQQGQILFLTPDDKNLSADYPLTVVNLKTNLNELVQNLKTQQALGENQDYNADTWADMGIWLVLLSLPIMLLCFRRNVLFLFLMGCFIPSAHAGWFEREDQRIYRLNNQAVQAYRQGQYQQAYDLFQDAYNQGNALAFQGKIKQAIDAYDTALRENPDDEDAKFNKEYLEKQLQNQDKNQSKENQEQQQNQSDSDNQTENQNNSDKENEQNENQSSESETEQSEQKNTEQESEPQNAQPTQDETASELEQALSDQPSEEPFNQKEQQILNRLNLDPSRVLRYRLNLQHQRNQR